MYKKMPYAPAKDLLPIVLTTSQPNVLAVAAGNPANTVPEFVAWAKKQGDKLSYGSVGNGSSSHLTMELFKSVAGFDAVHVPYAGSPPAGTSLAAGETQALMTVAPALLPLIQGGRIKLIATTSAQRTDGMKDLPTVADSGYPGFESLAWNGLFTAAGTPADVIDRINADVNAVLKDPAVRDALGKQGLIAGGGTPAEFKAFIDSEGKKWGAIIKRVGITVD
jgi:tripartite-type tricarboxylate transporter receptor subunit TctC